VPYAADQYANRTQIFQASGSEGALCGKSDLETWKTKNWSIAILWVIENGMIKTTVGVGPQSSSADPGNFDNLLPHKPDEEGRHHKQIDGLIKC
jgi:hypothetical protein